MNRFSHIYIEKAALGHSITDRVIGYFKNSQIVQIDDYKRVFNRPRQQFVIQKKSPKIILAVKKPPFIYLPSDWCQNYGNDNFRYTTPALNCIYNCDYCYLQGMFNSSNLVFFVNHSNFEDAANEAILTRPQKDQPLLLSVSYETDLMAIERQTGYCEQWISFARKTPDVQIEIRTKCSSIDALLEMEACDRVILAWSLAPEAVSKRYERGSPSPGKRLESAIRAVGFGWKVRLCFDPVIPLTGWKNAYSECIREIFDAIPQDKLLDVSFGPFRMSDDHFKRARRKRFDCDLFDFATADSNCEIAEFMFDELRAYLPENKIVSFQ